MQFPPGWYLFDVCYFNFEIRIVCLIAIIEIPLSFLVECRVACRLVLQKLFDIEVVVGIVAYYAYERT